MDGFERVEERAVEAAVADGPGFSAADIEILCDGVLVAAVSDALVVKACYMETLAFVQIKKENDQVISLA